MSHGEYSALWMGKCVIGVVKKKMMDFYHVEPKDLDGIVQQLRIIKGVEVAIFIYEVKPQEFKVSLRSKGKVNVNEVASYFGGGGLVLARLAVPSTGRL